MLQKIESNEPNDDSIRKWPVGMFWTREDNVAPGEAQRLSFELRDMPVHGTSYLLEDGATYLLAVPYRHRN